MEKSKESCEKCKKLIVHDSQFITGLCSCPCHTPVTESEEVTKHTYDGYKWIPPLPEEKDLVEDWSEEYSWKDEIDLLFNIDMLKIDIKSLIKRVISSNTERVKKDLQYLVDRANGEGLMIPPNLLQDIINNIK